MAKEKKLRNKLSSSTLSQRTMYMLLASYLMTYVTCKKIVLNENIPPAPSIFREEQVIFTSRYNITKLLVPADGSNLSTDSSEMPSIFFTVSDPKSEGGTCIYVLEGLAAYEILEGGRDSTADYSFDRVIYFGAKDGIYKYNADSLSAKKYGLFSDNIIQLQKANGTDAIFFLNADHRMFKVEREGTVMSRIDAVTCALEFVLDTSNNIYYVSCEDKLPHIVKSDGSPLGLTASVMEDFKDIKLVRPAFIMDKSVLFFGDGTLHILYANGSSEKKDFHMDERPTAFSVDASLYLVAALNGRIYEFNVMEVLLKSMFGVTNDWPKDVRGMIMSIIGNARENIMGYYGEM